MRKFVLILVLSLAVAGFVQAQDDDDSDFLEFSEFDEEFDGKEEVPVEVPSKSKQTEEDDDGLVENEESEFEGFDEEEFEGFVDQDEIKIDPKKAPEPKITVAKVPLHYHFRAHWDSYWMELLALAGLFVYFFNYFIGRSKNAKLANLWLSTHRSILEENFVLVGDDGRKEGEPTCTFIKESESLYSLWCSGRTCCEGMLVELKMIKRQDLVSIISGLMRPVQDQLQIKVDISQDAMDTFVFCVATKKTATRVFKEMSDLSKFCILVTKPSEKYNTPAGYSVLSEIPEATAAILDSKLIAAMNKYGHLIDCIHISDQYCGIIQQEDPNQLKQPEVQRVLIANFNLQAKHDMEDMKPLLILVLYMMERLKRFRLSREAKNKAEKNRSRVEEQFMKITHNARAEAAAQKREEKRKAEKEKILSEDDPDKQRKWEKKEQKRQAKKNQPKMKQLSIKAL